MKKIVAFAAITYIAAFSVMASASESIEQADSNHLWLFIALGILCLMELREKS